MNEKNILLASFVLIFTSNALAQIVSSAQAFVVQAVPALVIPPNNPTINGLNATIQEIIPPGFAHLVTGNVLFQGPYLEALEGALAHIWTQTQDAIVHYLIIRNNEDLFGRVDDELLDADDDIEDAVELNIYFIPIAGQTLLTRRTVSRELLEAWLRGSNA